MFTLISSTAISRFNLTEFTLEVVGKFLVFADVSTPYIDFQTITWEGMVHNHDLHKEKRCLHRQLWVGYAN